MRPKGLAVLGACIALPAAAFHYGGDLAYLACKWSASRSPEIRAHVRNKEQAMTTHARTTDTFDYFWEREPEDNTGIWAYLDAKPLPRRDFGSEMPEREQGFRLAHVDLDDIEVIQAPVSQAPERTCDNAACEVVFEEDVCDELTFCSHECAEGYLLQTA